MFAVEEASHSHSETEDSTASPGKETSAKSSLAKDMRDDEQSGDSTDVEDSEAVKQNVAHVGDGDKADGMFTTNSVYGIRCIYCKMKGKGWLIAVLCLLCQ